MIRPELTHESGRTDNLLAKCVIARGKVPRRRVGLTHLGVEIPQRRPLLKGTVVVPHLGEGGVLRSQAAYGL